MQQMMTIEPAIAKSNFRKRKPAICTKHCPEIGRFQVPIQKLLAVELEKVEEGCLPLRMVRWDVAADM